MKLDRTTVLVSLLIVGLITYFIYRYKRGKTGTAASGGSSVGGALTGYSANEGIGGSWFSPSTGASPGSGTSESFVEVPQSSTFGFLGSTETQTVSGLGGGLRNLSNPFNNPFNNPGSNSPYGGTGGTYNIHTR